MACAVAAAHHFFPLLLLPCDAARSSAQGLQPQDENKNPVRFHSEPHRVVSLRASPLDMQLLQIVPHSDGR